MPRKKKGNVTRYQRKRKKRSIPLGLFANKTKMAFRYCTTITLDAGISNFSYHTFSANSLYDPDRTGVGHSVLGFDQYMAFYQHYTVIGSKIKATVLPTFAGVSGQCFVGIVKGRSAAPAIVALDTLRENPRSNVKVAQGFESKQVNLTQTCSPSKFYGTNVMDERSYAGQVTSNPAEEIFFNVIQGSINEGVQNPGGIQVQITIDYIAMLHEPKLLTGS